MPEQSVKEQPQVTVRNIPQNQYEQNAAAGTQDASGQQPGMEGHFKKHWVVYSLVIGAATLLVIVYMNSKSSSSSNTSTGTGYDTSGTTAAADTYGASLDSDYQQLIQQGNTTNSLLQQLLTGGTTTGTSSSGGSTSGSGGKKKKPPKTSGGGTTNKKTSSGGSTKKTTSGSKTSTTSSSHSVGTSHSSGKTTIKANPTAGGAKGYTYTTKAGDTLLGLSAKSWGVTPIKGTNQSKQNIKGGIFAYANNKALLKSQGITNYSQTLKPGTKIVL